MKKKRLEKSFKKRKRIEICVGELCFFFPPILLIMSLPLGFILQPSGQVPGPGCVQTGKKEMESRDVL